MSSVSTVQSRTTLLFPGQGAHDLQMLEGVKHLAQFSQRYEVVCDLLGSNPLQEIEKGNSAYLNQNLVSSTLTLLVSSLLLERYKASGCPTPTFLAGYSVGQWLALSAAKVISYEKLMEIMKTRAELMDNCFNDQKGGMLAVIGLSEETLKRLCQALEAEGQTLAISNYNCAGQFSLAGTAEAVAAAQDRIQALKPKKVVRLPVSGGWHCALLAKASSAFRAYLQAIPFNKPELPIIDNVTGDFLPETEPELKEQLALHLSSAVQWDKGIKTLIAHGSHQFIEVGYGNTLTKFGFFIDRSVQYHSVMEFSGSQTLSCVVPGTGKPGEGSVWNQKGAIATL
jgi:[acyl-carrier-protein] S-malonyltransferase